MKRRKVAGNQFRVKWTHYYSFLANESVNCHCHSINTWREDLKNFSDSLKACIKKLKGGKDAENQITPWMNPPFTSISKLYPVSNLRTTSRKWVRLKNLYFTKAWIIKKKKWETKNYWKLNFTLDRLLVNLPKWTGTQFIINAKFPEMEGIWKICMGRRNARVIKIWENQSYWKLNSTLKRHVALNSLL